MDAATLSTIAALGGTAVGGLTSGLTTLINQRAQARADRIAHFLSRREDLVRDFIIAASKTYGEALTTNEPDLTQLIGLYSLISRMRVQSMPRTVQCGETLMNKIIETYYEPKRTVRDLHELVKTGSDTVDPLRMFSEAASEELTTFPAG